MNEQITDKGRVGFSSDSKLCRAGNKVVTSIAVKEYGARKKR